VLGDLDSGRRRRLASLLAPKSLARADEMIEE
jgi:hypothetical protein